MEIDIKSLIKTDKWANTFNPNLLSNKVNNNWFSDYSVISNEQFQITNTDKILVLDVIDHAVDPMRFINSLKTCCNIDTIIEILVHPYTSRSATHTTKAFSHLFGACNKRHNRFITHSQYKELFKGFEIIGIERYKQTIEDWFFAPCFKLEMEKTGFSLNSTEFQTNMINYTLKLCQ